MPLPYFLDYDNGIDPDFQVNDEDVLRAKQNEGIYVTCKAFVITLHSLFCFVIQSLSIQIINFFQWKFYLTVRQGIIF